MFTYKVLKTFRFFNFLFIFGHILDNSNPTDADIVKLSDHIVLHDHIS